MLRKSFVTAVCLGLVCSFSLAADPEEATVGQKAPDFEVTGIDGKTFKLSDKLGKKKNVVLMFSRAFW